MNSDSTPSSPRLCHAPSGNAVPVTRYPNALNADASQPLELDFRVGFLDVLRGCTEVGLGFVVESRQPVSGPNHNAAPDFRAGQDRACFD
jgi:hypothetical protein